MSTRTVRCRYHPPFSPLNGGFTRTGHLWVFETGENASQIDLLFDRDDKVFTLCEAKHQITPVGKTIIQEVERKAQRLVALYPKRTVHRVLLLSGDVSSEVERSGYFYRIIRAEELA